MVLNKNSHSFFIVPISAVPKGFSKVPGFETLLPKTQVGKDYSLFISVYATERDTK